MEYEKPKFGTKKWFENYWYHYKWHTIAGLFLLFVIVTFVADMLGKEVYDTEVSVNCKTAISYEQSDQMSRLLSQYATDYDGNGEVNVGVNLNVFPPNETDAQMMMAAQVKFAAEVSEGNSMIMIMDDYIYDQIGDPTVFCDLSVYSDKAYDQNRKIKLSDTPLGEDPLLAEIADDIFLVLRSPDTHAVKRNEESLAQYENDIAVLENLLTDNKISPLPPEEE